MTQASDPRLVPLRDSLQGRALRGTQNVTYYLRDCIGEGGQGWVFRANWDDPSGHVVIVKVLRPDVIATEALRRFQREAEVLKMLSTTGRPNPYIVRFFDHAVANIPSPYGPEPLTLPFTVLEYVDGTTLERVLSEQKGRGLPAERVRRLLRQMSQALDVVHAQKVVHRDLKPSNILLATEAGTEVAKVTDFGLVKLVDMNLQKTAALAGASLGYAPPEQYEQGNQRVSARTDLFSLAAVAFEMLAGKPAFPFNDGENPLLIVTRILNAPRPTLMKHRANMAPELESQPHLIEALDRELGKALAADPLNRHESAKELWNAIEPTLRAAAEEKSAPPTPKSDVNPWQATAPIKAQSERDVREAKEIRVAASHVQMRAVSAQPYVSAPVITEARPPETQAGNPAAWSWTLLTLPLGPAALRTATFSPGGDVGVALSTAGLMRWERGAWIPIALPAHVPRNAIRGLRWLRDGSTLFFGDAGVVGRIERGGAASLWRVPDSETSFYGALVEDSGVTTLVGERPYRGAAARQVPGSTAGVVTQFSGDRVTLMGDAVNCTRLRGVARLAGGQLVACGEWGAIARIELGVVEHVGSICGGHLTAIAALPDGGALTVGVGGHALSLSPRLEAQLEAVQTTRDLLSLAVTEDGQAWAGSAQARLLRRSGGSWVRMSGDIGVASSMIATAAGPRSIRAIGDDGAVVEGRIS